MVDLKSWDERTRLKSGCCALCWCGWPRKADGAQMASGMTSGLVEQNSQTQLKQPKYPFLPYPPDILNQVDPISGFTAKLSRWAGSQAPPLAWNEQGGRQAPGKDTETHQQVCSMFFCLPLSTRCPHTSSVFQQFSVW